MDEGALAPCIAHDLFSGIVRNDLSYIFVWLEKHNHIDWKFLQSAFLKFRHILRFEDRSNWFARLGAKATFLHIPGNHAGNHSLIRFFALFFFSFNPNDKVNKQNKYM
jgi:hypothetical protein